MVTDRCDCPLVSTSFPFSLSFARTVIPVDMQIISTLNVRFERIIFQKVLPLGKYHSNAKLQVHSSRLLHARATRFTSGNAARPIRQGKKNLASIETFEIEFHLTESQIGISKVQVACMGFQELEQVQDSAISGIKRFTWNVETKT
jgi:hypothetical protein